MQGSDETLVERMITPRQTTNNKQQTREMCKRWSGVEWSGVVVVMCEVEGQQRNESAPRQSVGGRQEQYRALKQQRA
jgi:hypothetical protein